MNTEMGMVIYMYLKHSPDYIDSKYIWVHGLRLKCFCRNTILVFVALHRERKRCDPAHVTPTVKFYMHTKFRSVAPNLQTNQITTYSHHNNISLYMKRNVGKKKKKKKEKKKVRIIGRS